MYNLIEQIKGALSDDLLKPKYRSLAGLNGPTAGHCYHASEALWHALGGPQSPYTPTRGRDETGITHWWLRHKETGEILDPTADQYLVVGCLPPYSAGKGGGFLTKKPSRPAQTILNRIGFGIWLGD